MAGGSRRLFPMKKRPPGRRPFITRIQTNIFGENAELNSLRVLYILRGVDRRTRQLMRY